MSDLRFALRQLIQSPGFTVVAVLALALGIGANTAIYSVVRAVLLRPLPFPQQEQLAFMSEWSEQVPNMSVSYPNFTDLRDRQRSFSAFGATRSQGFNYIGSDEPVRITGTMASAGVFTALGVAPVYGRLYSENEDKPGAERTVLLSEGLWRRLFGGRPSVLGEQINLSGQLYTVIGIMPEQFSYPSPRSELWVPLGLWAGDYTQRGNHPGIYCVGRLAPGVSLQQAESDLKGIAQQLAEEYPATNARQSITLQPLVERAFGRVRPALLVLLGAAGCVLLIACANVANLQLARAHARSREFAVRSALGAGRSRIFRQLLLENLVLGLIGCAAGLLLGWWALEGLKQVLPSNLPRVEEVTLDSGVLLFAVVASLLTSVGFGLAPAWHASRQDLRGALVQGGRSGTGAGARLRASLIIAEFALTCVLLTGAGLMLRTFANLHAASPGFETTQRVTFNWVLPAVGHETPEKRRPLIEQALTRLQQLPGVTHVGLINPLPLSGSGNQNTYYVEGTPDPEPGRQPSAEYFAVSEDTFAALGMPLIAGRPFDHRDTAESRKVAIVDTRFVEKNFGAGANAIGRRFAYGSNRPDAEDAYMEIVGVVPHIHNYGLGQDTREQTYTPAAQSAPSTMTFILETQQDPAALGDSARRAMTEVSRTLPIFGLQTMDTLFDQSIGTQRLTVVLLSTFAGLALLLASVGLYGVLSYNVGQRTREIGVRMALGATGGAVVRLVVRQGLLLATAGLMIGIGLALVSTRLLESVLYNVQAVDPLVFVLALALLIAIGVLACWVPARRASRINPVEALRAE